MERTASVLELLEPPDVLLKALGELVNVVVPGRTTDLVEDEELFELESRLS